MKKIKFLAVPLVLFFCFIMSHSFKADASSEVITFMLEENRYGYSATVLTSGIYFFGTDESTLTKDNFIGDLDFYNQAPGSGQIAVEDIGKKFNVNYKNDVLPIANEFESSFGSENVNDYGFFAINVHSYAVFFSEKDLICITMIGALRNAQNTDCTIAGNMTHIVDYDHPISVDEIKARYHATDNVDGDITNQIQFKTNYKPQSLTNTGAFYIFMSVSDHSGHTTYAADLILVKDLSAPVIQLSQTEYKIEVNTVFTLSDAKKFFTATDNLTPQNRIQWTYDDHLKNQYNKLGTYTITATAKDSSSNASSKTLTIHVVDTTKPTLSLAAGGDTIIADHVLSDNEIKALIQVSDNYDTLSNSNIQIVENTCTGAQGKEYRLKVTIKDSSNNIGEKVFKYILSDTESPIIMVEKTIYIPLGSNFTNEQIIQMLKEAGIIDFQSMDVSLTSCNPPTDTEGVYEITYQEILKDGSKKEGKIKLNVFSPLDEAEPTTSKPKTRIWVYFLLVLSILAIPALLILKKKSYEKN